VILRPAGFYHQPASIEDLIDFVDKRGLLNQLDLPSNFRGLGWVRHDACVVERTSLLLALKGRLLDGPRVCACHGVGH